jgi:hypothetical protein
MDPKSLATVGLIRGLVGERVPLDRRQCSAIGNAGAMSTNKSAAWPVGDVLTLRPDLSAKLNGLLERAADRLPGRLEALMSARVEQLRGREAPDPVIGELARNWHRNPELSAGEQAALDLTERFVIDVRSIGDDGFDVLKAHYSSDELAAISFRLALLEGMSKFDTLFPGRRP